MCGHWPKLKISAWGRYTKLNVHRIFHLSPTCHLLRALLVTGDYKYRAARLEVLDGLRLVARDYS